MKPIVLRVYPAAFSFEIHQTPPPFLSMKREDCPTLTRIGLVHVSSTDTNGQQTCQQLAAPAQVRYGGGPLPGTRPAISPNACDATVKRLEKTLEENKMGLVAQASASRGSAARGVKIPGK